MTHHRRHLLLTIAAACGSLVIGMTIVLLGQHFIFRQWDVELRWLKALALAFFMGPFLLILTMKPMPLPEWQKWRSPLISPRMHHQISRIEMVLGWTAIVCIFLFGIFLKMGSSGLMSDYSPVPMGISFTVLAFCFYVIEVLGFYLQKSSQGPGFRFVGTLAMIQSFLLQCIGGGLIGVCVILIRLYFMHWG